MKNDSQSSSTAPPLLPVLHKRKTKQSDAEHESGFTLIETVIALVIMMVAALSIISLFVYAIKYNSGANKRAVATAVAQQRAERLRSTAFTDIVTVAAESVASGGFTFNVATNVANTTATLKTIRIVVTPQAGDAAWTATPISLTTQRSAIVVGSYSQ